MATLTNVFDETRAHLADVAAEVWTDAVLLVFAQRAYRTCARYLRSKEMGLFRKQSTSVEVAAGKLGLARTGETDYPTYLTAAPLLLRPIELRESTVTTGPWTAMRSSDGFTPAAAASGGPLEIWDWREDKIIFPAHAGATVYVQILYEYELAALTTGADTILIPDALDAMALMTASFAAKSRDEKGISEMFKNEATADLDLIARAESAVKKAAGARWGTQ